MLKINVNKLIKKYFLILFMGVSFVKFTRMFIKIVYIICDLIRCVVTFVHGKTFMNDDFSDFYTLVTK